MFWRFDLVSYFIVLSTCLQMSECSVATPLLANSRAQWLHYNLAVASPSLPYVLREYKERKNDMSEYPKWKSRQ